MLFTIVGLSRASAAFTMTGMPYLVMTKFCPAILLLSLLTSSALAAPKNVRVFVALCDNKTQGIEKVGEKIGNGDVPDENLYWGCSDGFGSLFRHSREWKVTEARENVSEVILRRMELKHSSGDVRLIAEAYRGSAMKQCLEDFERAVAGGENDLVVFIGHNGLMDFPLTQTIRSGERSKTTDAIVLCCMSEGYFKTRLENAGARPVLLTQQLMYPGAFILHDVLEVWRAGGSTEEIRNAAGKAYAKNQKISVKAATGVFAPAPH